MCIRDRLYSVDFADTAVGYRKHMDVKSFIDYFLVNEVSRNNDGFKTVSYTHLDVYKRQKPFRTKRSRKVGRSPCPQDCRICLLYTSRCV